MRYISPLSVGGSTTVASTDITDSTTVGRSVITAADAAAARTNIGVGTGGGDASTNTSTSADSEVALFSSTSGKILKRASMTGIPKLTSGVIGVGVAGTDYVSPSSTETLTNKTLTTPVLTNPTITNYTESVVAIGTVTTASTLSLTSGTVQTATLTASTACTFTMPTATAGKSFVLYLKQAASTGNGSATFTSVKWPGGTAPTITTTAGKMDILSFVSDGTNWYGSFSQNYTY